MASVYLMEPAPHVLPEQVMPNPWRQANLFTIFKNLLRLALWTCLVINSLMLALFSILFTAAFLRHLWGYCQRTLFDNPW